MARLQRELTERRRALQRKTRSCGMSVSDFPQAVGAVIVGHRTKRCRVEHWVIVDDEPVQVAPAPQLHRDMPAAINGFVHRMRCRGAAADAANVKDGLMGMRRDRKSTRLNSSH